jgi:hypothetical protein
MKTINYIILLSLLLATACNSSTDQESGTTAKRSKKTQNIDEAFAAVHSASKSSIAEKLEKKIKSVKDGDSRKAIIALFDGEGLPRTMSSLSSNNEVEIRTKGNKRQVTLVTKSSFKERVTRFVLEFDKGAPETGTFDVAGMSLFIETYKKDGAAYEITSAESWVKGTIKILENDDNKLKGTAKLNIPKLNFTKNGTKESTSEDVKIELAFYNANL